MSTTTLKLIGLKEFRSNIAEIWKKARRDNIRYVVMYHSKPVLEVSPINNRSLDDMVSEARTEYFEGKTRGFSSAKAFIGDLRS